MSKMVKNLFLAVIVLLLCDCLEAVRIDYFAENISGNLWKYQYSIVNYGTYSIGSVSIFFNDDYSGITPSSSSQITSDWDEQIFSFSAEQTIYDVLANPGKEIAIGQGVSGFSVTFNYLGSGIPASQDFEIYDPQDYSLLESGTTVPIPEPATILLLATGLIAMGKRKQSR